MTTTVRVEDEVKSEIDRLQGLVLAETGKRITQSELLWRLVRYARRSPESLFRESDDWAPPSPADFDAWLARLPEDGAKTDSSRMDEALYDEDR